MNLIDAWVTKIISDKPVFKYDKYWINVECNVMGHIQLSELMFDTEQEALDIKVGYKFLT